MSRYSRNIKNPCPECGWNSKRERTEKEPKYICHECGAEFNEDEIYRVLEDKNTGQTLYYIQLIKGFETALMTADEIEEMEACKSEVGG